MNKKKLISATLALSIGLSGTYAIAPFANETKAAEAAVEQAFKVKTDVSVQKNQLASFEEIKALFAEDQVDLAKVKAYYDEHFKMAVQERDVVAAENITALLELGVQGEATVGQVKQAVDKGLQWFFYNEVRHFDREAGTALADGNIQLANENLDKAITLFEGSVLVTAGKRDNNFGTLTQDFFENIAIPGMRTAIENKDVTNFHVWRQYFEKTMMKVFVLATTRYANVIPEDYAKGDTETLKAHLAEGYFFFMPIHDYLVSGNKEAADSIKNAFGSGDGAAVKAIEIEKWLMQAITTKVNGYIDSAIHKDLAAGDKAKALIHAAEGNAFASQLEVFINDELGKNAYSTLQTYGENFFNAVKANDADKAEQYGKEMKSLLDQLSGNQLANFETMKSFFSTEEVDLSEVQAFYEENFAELVKARNSQINDEITLMLKAGVDGEATSGQVKQAVDKGLQWYFYEEINDLVRNGAGKALEEGNKQQALIALDRALTLFEGSVYITAGKRDNDFGTLTQDFLGNVAVTGLKQAIDTGDVTTFNVYRQYFQKTMMKVFVLATTRYAHKVPEDHAKGDVATEKAHLAEGYFFFMPIHNYLAGGDKEASDSIRASFGSGDGANVNGDQIEKWLTNAITAKVNEYIDSAINKDLATGDQSKALIHAAEGNAFASMLEVFINENLGKETYVSLQTHGEKFYKAVQANDVAAATKHGEEIIKIITQLDHGTSSKVSEKENVKSIKQQEVIPTDKKTTSTTNDIVYTVKKGDTLSEIGVEYGIHWKELAEYNKLENPSLILIGQQILIPSK
ncbi:LysM peptidoglycan-binding domain-containing protein [Bacillus sp. Marseille-P3661]|uniref:LysM peptidoglycan-binding domain-containing protein n=1 Tax=Bacillus sp. Marseille-P3661 TaxID=1936234 RepID=UPI002155E059|nr:LysM peptidoglycan-binding domain-containing protein [Bacillus sp. Marseille-P3661]